MSFDDDIRDAWRDHGDRPREVGDLLPRSAIASTSPSSSRRSRASPPTSWASTSAHGTRA